MVVGSQLPVTPGPDDALFVFGFFRLLHIRGMHTDIHINKAKNKYFLNAREETNWDRN